MIFRSGTSTLAHWSFVDFMSIFQDTDAITRSESWTYQYTHET